jgi:hypothetical protein
VAAFTLSSYHVGTDGIIWVPVIFTNIRERRSRGRGSYLGSVTHDYVIILINEMIIYSKHIKENCVDFEAQKSEDMTHQAVFGHQPLQVKTSERSANLDDGEKLRENIFGVR